VAGEVHHDGGILICVLRQVIECVENCGADSQWAGEQVDLRCRIGAAVYILKYVGEALGVIYGFGEVGTNADDESVTPLEDRHNQ